MFIKVSMRHLTEIIEVDENEASEAEFIEMFKEETLACLRENVQSINDLQNISEIVVERIPHPGDEWLLEQIKGLSDEIKQLTVMKNRYEGLLMGRNKQPLTHHSV